MLCKACMLVFEGDSTYREVARSLDYFAYGAELQARASQIARGVIKEVGDRQAGDVIEVADSK